MGVRYNNLFKILIDKGLKKTEFAKQVGFSANTLAKLSRNEMVSLDVIVRICNTLGCTVDDVLDIVPCQEPESSESKASINTRFTGVER